MIHKTETLTEKVLKGSSVILLFTLLGSPLGYLIRILYSYTLSIEKFGLFYAAFNLFALISIYLDLGLGYSITYLIPKYFRKNDLKRVGDIFQHYLVTQIVFTVLVAVALFLGTNILAELYFKSKDATNLVYMFCIYLVCNSMFSVLNMLFTGLQKEKYYASMQFFRLACILVFSVLFWIFDAENIVYYALAWAVATFVIVIVYTLVAMKKYGYVFSKLHWDSKLFISMLKYGIPTLITTTLFSFIGSADVIFLTIFKGVREVGIFSVIFSLATVSSIFLTPINALILPLTSELMEHENTKVQRLVQQTLKLIPFVGLYFGTFVALFPSSVTGTLFGGKWIGLVELPLIVFSLGFVMSSLSSYLVTILSGMGKVKERLKLSILIVIIDIVLSLILIRSFGVMGAVVTNTIVYIVSVILFTKAIGKTIQLQYSFFFYTKLTLFVISIFVLVRLFHIYPVGLFQVLVCGLIYSILFFIFGTTQGVADSATIEILTKKLKRLPFYESKNSPTL